MLAPRKVLVIEDDEEWQRLLSEELFPRPTEVMVDAGRGYRQHLDPVSGPELVLIDFRLEGAGRTGRDILGEVRERLPAACVGLISSIRGGFTAQDVEHADFFIDKNSYFLKDRALPPIRNEWVAFMRSACEPSIRDEFAPLETVLVQRPDPQRGGAAAAEAHEALCIELRGAGVRVLEVRDLLHDVLAMAGEDERAAYLTHLFVDPVERGLLESLPMGSRKGSVVVPQAALEAALHDPGQAVDLLFAGFEAARGERGRSRGLERHAALSEGLRDAHLVRDPGLAIEGGLVAGSLAERHRVREARVLELVFDRHPWFVKTPLLALSGLLRERDTGGFVSIGPAGARLSGGDVVALGQGKLAIGWSGRTSLATIRWVAEQVLGRFGYDEVWAVGLPDGSACQLDGVLGIVAPSLAVWDRRNAPRDLHFLRFARGASARDLAVRPGFFGALRKRLGFDLLELRGAPARGRGRQEAAFPASVLAVGGRKVLSFAAREEVNEELRKAGMDVVGLPGADLAGDRGGPRSLVMPVRRG